MHQYKNFIRFFWGSTIFLLLAVTCSNLIVDPYGINRNGGRVKNDRLVKALKVNKIQPKTVLLGSSGVARGLDPNHTALSDVQPAYNLSLMGANIYEIKRYFEHAAANSDLKTVIIGLDFYAFNSARDVMVSFSENRLGNKHLTPSDFLGIYLSLDSLNLILNPEERGLYFAEDGTYEHPIHLSMQEQFEVKLVEDFTREEQMYWDYQFSQETINHFKEIIETAHENGIEVKIFIPPMHTTLFYSAIISNYWEIYRQWIYEVVSIHPVWDFSGCNSVTNEPISETMQWFEDTSHYTDKSGNLILDSMFGYRGQNKPDDFGIYVTENNLENHLNQVQLQCQNWAQNNSDIISWLENLNLKRKMIISSNK